MESEERRMTMKWDPFEGNPEKFHQGARVMKGDLTDKERDQVNGGTQQRHGKIQEKYVTPKKEAGKQIKQWLNDF